MIASIYKINYKIKIIIT